MRSRQLIDVRLLIEQLPQLYCTIVGCHQLALLRPALATVERRSDTESRDSDVHGISTANERCVKAEDVVCHSAGGFHQRIISPASNSALDALSSGVASFQLLRNRGLNAVQLELIVPTPK